jgi:hypothetical protein
MIMPARLRSLALGELVNIPLQAWLWFGALGFPATAANLAGFAAFVMLLLEGAAYWAAKLHQLRTRRGRLPGIRLFRAARVVNLPLLAAALGFTAAAALSDPGRNSWLGLGFALFAVLEHVNYFHIQLMHSSRADLRRLGATGLHRSHLSTDLSRW